MTAENSTSNPAPGNGETTETAVSAADTAEPAEQGAPDADSSRPVTAANVKPAPKPASRPIPAKATSAAQPATAARPGASPKPAVDKPQPPPPEPPAPSLPVSMIVRPHCEAHEDSTSLFPGELDGSFESALARVELAQSRDSIAEQFMGAVRRLFRAATGVKREPFNVQRMVAFDGFRNSMFEEKRERDRRYGTVYTVSEEVNALLVRLELPRRMSNSSLRRTWELPDEMPDYACMVSLTDNVLLIRAGLPDEARRRLSYVSPSFPSDFQTRIEFDLPVEGFKHRLRDKVLEIIVFKSTEAISRMALSRAELHD